MSMRSNDSGNSGDDRRRSGADPGDPTTPRSWGDADSYLSPSPGLTAWSPEEQMIVRDIGDRPFPNLDQRDSDDAISNDAASDDEGPFYLTVPVRPLYEDLGKQNVTRLFKLDPLAILGDHSCHMETFPLDSTPDYYALSYCWGSPDRSESLMCNFSDLRVSRQLKKALYELAKNKDFQHEWFWIDQICINQTDLDERSHQVNLMQDIYSRAKCTVVWLSSSRESKEYDSAFDLAGKICNIGQDDRFSQPSRSLRIRRPKRMVIGEGEIASLGLPPYSDLSWYRLKTVLSNDWFHRIWIIQEAALSSKTPVLVHNGVMRNWEHLLWSAAWLYTVTGPSYALGTDSSFFHSLRAIFNLTYSRKRWEFSSLLIQTHGFLATDQRDKVFALLSLAASEQNEEQGKWPLALAPDYKKIPERVFRDATFHLVSNARDLILLSLINFDPDPRVMALRNGLPSWTPNYYQAYPPLDVFDVIVGDATIRLGRPTRASGDRLAEIKEKKCGNSLTLKGVKIDRVAWSAEPDRGPYKVLRWCEEGARRLHKLGELDWDGYLKNFFNTLTHGGLAAPMPSLTDFRQYLLQHKEHSSSRFFELFLKEDVRPTPSFHEPNSLESSIGNHEMIQNLEHKYAMGGQFFITENKMMGQGPAYTRSEDEIVILFGGAAPFVLRPRKGRSGETDGFLLMGECYLSDWMSGEVQERVASAQVEEDWFSLR
jgi:hypothetical protein